MSVITRNVKRPDGSVMRVTGGAEDVQEFERQVQEQTEPVDNELVMQMPREFEPFRPPKYVNEEALDVKPTSKPKPIPVKPRYAAPVGNAGEFEPLLAPVINYDGDEPKIVYQTEQKKEAPGTPYVMPGLFD